ncbi:MAG: hypothetical protein ING29_09360 [Azospirillum sp.]|nr:hypothetical protein [Azospirillum sp.]
MHRRFDAMEGPTSMLDFVRTSIVVATILSVVQSTAWSQTFLTTEEAIARIADGRAWNATTSGGRKVKIMLRPDGTGQFDGPISTAIAWRVERSTICLKIGFMGERCLLFRPVDNGFEGWRDGVPEMTLARHD